MAGLATTTSTTSATAITTNTTNTTYTTYRFSYQSVVVAAAEARPPLLPLPRPQQHQHHHHLRDRRRVLWPADEAAEGPHRFVRL